MSIHPFQDSMMFNQLLEALHVLAAPPREMVYRLPVGATCLQMALAGKPWTNDRLFDGLRNGRSGLANRKSTVAFIGGLDTGNKLRWRG